ncbi:MAG: hypothetical protein ACFE95_04440 [Candidatus Hodarchaeota archaeon]
MLINEEKEVELLQLDSKISGAVKPYNDPIHLLKETEVYILIDDAHKKIFLWIGSQAGVWPRFIGTNAAQQIQRNRGLTHRVISIDQGEETVEFIQSISSIDMIKSDQFKK